MIYQPFKDEHRMWHAIKRNVCRDDKICEHIYNLIEIVCHLPQIDGAQTCEENKNNVSFRPHF